MSDATTEKRDADDGLIVAVFDTKTMALRTIQELRAANVHDCWLGVVSGETFDGETTIVVDHAPDDELLLHRVLSERGATDAHAHRFDGILPPGSAVMALSVQSKYDRVVDIVELTGGHIERI